MSKHKPFFSIVTVVKDDVEGLYETLSSVSIQSIAPEELDVLIIDGGFLPEIKKCVETHTLKSTRGQKHAMRHLRGVDSGIYDAMNKGIVNACGVWILFLNTADVFCDATALLRIYNSLKHSDYFLQREKNYAYVATDFYEDLRGHLIRKKVIPLQAMPFAMPTSHQALFIRADKAMEYLFDTRYRVCADAHQMARVLKNGYEVFVCNDCMVTVKAQGYSTRNFTRMMRERWWIQRKLYPSLRNFLYMSYFICMEYAKRYLRMMLPVGIKDALRTFKYKNNKSIASYTAYKKFAKKKKLLWLTTVLDESAVSKIFFLLAPYIKKKYDITFISIQAAESSAAMKKLSDMRIPFISLECKKLRVLYAAKKLSQYIAETSPAIVHAHLGRAYIVACAAYLRLKSQNKSPALLATFHNKFSYFSFLTRLAITHILPNFHGLSAVSQDCLNSYVRILNKKSCKRIRKTVLYNPVKYAYTSENPYKNAADIRSPILFCALRLCKHKGHEYVLHMMKELHKTYYPHACLYLAGDGPLRKKLETLVHHLKLVQYVHFLGHIKNVYAYMKYADVVIFPSQSEGFGLVPCEAFLQGTPVIMEDTFVARELFTSDVWYTPCKDKHAFCMKVHNVMKHKKKYRSYALQEKRVLTQRFHPQSIAQKYIQCFDDFV